MRNTTFLSLIVIAGLVLLAAPVIAEPPPGAAPSLWFTCNVGGASVAIDGTFMGTIPAGGELDVPYDPAYTNYEVTATGYNPASGAINYPLGGSSHLQIPVTLTPKPVGSGKGWITVHSNVDGASVAFGGVVRGTIQGGSFTYEVSTTGTPLSTYTVSKAGYESYMGPINQMPATDQTIDLYATLNPVPTTTVPTDRPTTVASPIGGSQGWFAIHANVNGASVYFDNVFKGTINAGVLNVPVYSTGTPYSAYRVEKSGYATASGTLPAAPAGGATRDVYVTLNAAPTYAPTPVPTTQGEIIGGDQGFYVVHSNVDGATVLFDSDRKGVITGGKLTVRVYTTGTPYRTFTVEKAGYASFNGQVNQYPAKGQTVDLYATLIPAPVTTAPTPTKSPLPVWIAGLAVCGGIFVATRAKKE